jgi:hypothetical protein
MSSPAKRVVVDRKRQTVAKVTSEKPAEKGVTEATVCAQGVSTPDEGLTLEEALRREGINERTIAKGYVSLHGKLINSEDKGDLKLFVDVLDKNSRILEPAHAADRRSASQNVTVILKHNMARPAREFKEQSSHSDHPPTI